MVERLGKGAEDTLAERGGEERKCERGIEREREVERRERLREFERMREVRLREIILRLREFNIMICNNVAYETHYHKLSQWTQVSLTSSMCYNREKASHTSTVFTTQMYSLINFK